MYAIRSYYVFVLQERSYRSVDFLYQVMDSVHRLGLPAFVVERKFHHALGGDPPLRKGTTGELVPRGADAIAGGE